MKNLVVLFASILLMTIAVEGVKAQNSVSESADASATIIAPMMITKNVDLSFGNVASGSNAGTVVLGVDDERSANNVILPSITGVVTAAQFTVTGLSGAKYKIALPASTSITNGSATMTINGFTANATEVLTGGTETFKVGATLNLDPDQAAGAYTGSFTVTVDYD
jgi:hypothetical protein